MDTRGDVLCPNLARNMGVANAVAAFSTSKMVEFAMTIMLNALPSPNLQSKKKIGKVIES